MSGLLRGLLFIISHHQGKQVKEKLYCNLISKQMFFIIDVSFKGKLNNLFVR
jgi:hypothetical protein